MLQYSFRANPPETQRKRTGQDQSWLAYSPIVGRPAIRWPNNARVALWICPCVVHYEYSPAADPWLNAWARTAPPDVMGYGRLEYGNRVGFWRMLDVLDKHEMRCTGIVNVGALQRFPEIAKAIAERRWALAGHGMTNTRFTYGYSEAEERSHYREMLRIVEATTGLPMRGMGGAGPQANTENTPDLLAEEGFLYHTDWFCDEQPFPLRVRRGRLVAMPYTAEINETLVLAVGAETDTFLEIVKRQFDQLYRDGKHSGRVMCVSLHPHLIGQPQRIRHLDAALAYLRSFPDVWHATGDEIAGYYLDHCYDDVVCHLGAAWEGCG
jgi:peptidoglycan/xylan/chitin deacetylase (PgdA/CDA1 family)